MTTIENQLEAIFTRFGGAAISWSSKRQNTIALSSCEAEFMAASEAAKEALWMRRLLDHFDYKGPRQIIIHADNKKRYCPGRKSDASRTNQTHRNSVPLHVGKSH